MEIIILLEIIVLFKAIMKRTQPRNQYFKLWTNESKLIHTRKRNYCISLISKSKKEFYVNVDVKDIKDNRKSWKTVKPLISDKPKSNPRKRIDSYR